MPQHPEQIKQGSTLSLLPIFHIPTGHLQNQLMLSIPTQQTVVSVASSLVPTVQRSIFCSFCLLEIRDLCFVHISDQVCHILIIFIMLWNFSRWSSHLSPLQTEQAQVFYSFDLLLNTGQWENLMANLGGKDIRVPKRSWERKRFGKTLTYFPELGFFSRLGQQECLSKNQVFFLAFIGHLQSCLIL